MHVHIAQVLNQIEELPISFLNCTSEQSLRTFWGWIDLCSLYRYQYGVGSPKQEHILWYPHHRRQEVGLEGVQDVGLEGVCQELGL